MYKEYLAAEPMMLYSDSGEVYSPTLFIWKKKITLTNCLFLIEKSMPGKKKRPFKHKSIITTV